MSATSIDPQSLRHLHALRSFIRNLVDQAEKSEGCDCHRPPSLLLVGPPGAGKTYLVKQMSQVCDMPLFGAHTHQLRGAVALRTMFREAREIDYPSLFFLDDIDVIFTDQNDSGISSPLAHGLRTELFAQLGPRKLKIFDPNSEKNPVQHVLSIAAAGGGVPSKEEQFQEDYKRRQQVSPASASSSDESQFPDNNGLIVVAATSAPWLLYKDHEILSRFRGVYLVGLPDRETRYHILKVFLEKVQHNLTDKDIWVVADKTEGYTPSDLLIVIKALNYKQFQFLFALAGARGGDSQGSSDDISSSGSETDSEDEEEEDEVNLRLKKSLLIEERRRAMTPVPPPPGDPSSKCHEMRGRDTPRHVPTPPLEGLSTLIRPESRIPAKSAPTVAVLQSDWHSDSHLEATPPYDDRATVDGDTPSSPDSALGRSKSSEEEIDVLKKEFDEVVNAAKEDGHLLPSRPKEEDATPKDDCNDANCDTSLSERDNVSDNKMVDRSVEEVEVVIDRREFVVRKNDSEEKEEKSIPALKADAVSLTSTEDVREFKLNIEEPPDPVRNDNKSIDSDRDSDTDLRSSPRPRRGVTFSGMPPMEPLSVEVDNLDMDSDGGFSRNIPSPPPLPPGDETDRANSSSILRNILGRSSSMSYRGSALPLAELLRNKREERDLRGDEDDRYGVFNNNSDMGASYDGGERRRSCPDLERNNLFGDSSPLKALLLGDSDSLKNKTSTPEPNCNSITPTPSETSVHSVASSGSGARVTAASSDSENVKKQDSESSLSRSDSHTNASASSDISTATCNETGETLECQSDVDDRFRNLSEDLAENQRGSSASDDEDTPTNTVTSAMLRGILNLEELGEITIQIITLADVLEVVSKTPKSVSDDEIKRYTDFMVWFAKVAKSACPHSNKKKGLDGLQRSGMDDISLSSSMSCATTQSSKKRRKPLKKVGYFLLKALMFILD